MKGLKQLRSDQYVQIKGQPMLAGLKLEETVSDRQDRVPGFDQARAARASIVTCGAGGLAAEQAPALVRKGYGRVICMDADFFSPSNYPRQFCYRSSLYGNKGIEMAVNIAAETLTETDLIGIGLNYQDARQYIDLDDYDIILCNVDNNETRCEVAHDLLKRRKAGVFAGVSADANSGYVFVQGRDKDDPCFGCAFPDKVNDTHHPCPNTPACVDILKTLGGFALYAVDSLLMNRMRLWNLRVVFLDGSLEDAARTIKKNPNYPICGSEA